MATTCRTSDGDLLDTLCYQYYGHLNGCVEAVLDANQGLADEPQPFRAGGTDPVAGSADSGRGDGSAMGLTLHPINRPRRVRGLHFLEHGA